MSEEHALWPSDEHDHSGIDEQPSDVPPLLDVNASEADVVAFLEGHYGAYRALVSDGLRGYFREDLEQAEVRGARPNRANSLFFAVVDQETEKDAPERERIFDAIVIAEARRFPPPAPVRRALEGGDYGLEDAVEELRQQYQDHKRRDHPLLDPDKRYGVNHLRCALLAGDFGRVAAIFVSATGRDRRKMAEIINAPLVED